MLIKLLLPALILWNVSEVSVFDELMVSNTYGDVTLSAPPKQRLKINCKNFTLGNESFPRLSFILRINYVEFINCATPNYASVLSSIGVDVTNVGSIEIRGHKSSSKLKKSHFSGLSLHTLKFFPFQQTSELTRYPLETDLLQSLTNLTNLLASQIVFPSLPMTSGLREVMLRVGSSEGEWGGCAKLQYLKLEQWDVLKEPMGTGWLAHCMQLTNITLVRVSSLTMTRVIKSASSIRSLTILESPMIMLPLNLLKGLTQLRQLHLMGNDLSIIQGNTFQSQSLLEHLDLSHNEFNGLDKARTVESLLNLHKLRELSLAHNPMRGFCDFTPTGDYYTLRDTLRSLPLKILDLSGTNLPKLCFAEWNSLSILNISENLIETLEFRELPIFIGREKPLEIYLNRNTIWNVSFQKPEYERLAALKNSVTQAQLPFVTIHSDVVWSKCDCEQAWLAQALHEGLVDVHVRCPNDRLLSFAPLDKLQCDRFQCRACTCRRSWDTLAVIARCASNVRTVPHELNLTELHAQGAHISELSEKDLPNTLRVLDVSNNQISRLNANVAAALFAVRERRVWLAGNPFICDCENQAMLTILSDNRKQVVDYANVTCITGQAVSDIALDELCIPRSMRVALASSGALLLALLSFLGALYYRYGKEIKVFLYARGWCLFCMRQDELDADRPYDVFISFAHDDFQLVTEEILPTLDQEYKVCIHYRDWIPGEMIPTQILKSVEWSRRTIIILSRNFVKSVWGLMEFRTAHTNALRDGCVRLIIVVVDDVVDDPEIDAELRGYLRTNTYLKWGDQWFWQKLRYALPHCKNDRQSRHDQDRQQHRSQQLNGQQTSLEIVTLPHLETNGEPRVSSVTVQNSA